MIYWTTKNKRFQFIWYWGRVGNSYITLTIWKTRLTFWPYMRISS